MYPHCHCHCEVELLTICLVELGVLLKVADWQAASAQLNHARLEVTIYHNCSNYHYHPLFDSALGRLTVAPYVSPRPYLDLVHHHLCIWVALPPASRSHLRHRYIRASRPLHLCPSLGTPHLPITT